MNRNQIRNDISCELSAGRWFIWNIKVFFLPEIPCACLKLLLNGSAWLEIWLISCIGLLCKMHTFFVLILYKGADQTVRMHGLSLSLYLHWQTVWTQNGPEYYTANANDNMGPYQRNCNRIDGLVSRCLRNQAKNTNFMPKHPSFSLSLSFYDLLSKFANSLDPEDRCYAGYMGFPLGEDFQSMYEPARCFEWIFLQDIISCYLVTYHMWQRFRRACANVHSQYSIQHAAWYTSQPAHNVGPLSVRQRNAIQMAVRWRAGGGPLLEVYLDKVGSRLQESPVVCFHTSTHRPKSIMLHVRQCRKERARLPI